MQSDIKNDKNTVISCIGLEKGKEWVRSYTEAAIEALSPLGERGNDLRALAEGLIERKM